MISTTLKNELSQFCSKYEQPIEKLTYLLNNQTLFAKELSNEDTKTFEQLLTTDQSTLLCYFALENNQIKIRNPLNHPDYQLIVTIYPDNYQSVVDVSIEHIKSKDLFSLAYVSTYQEDNELVTAYLYNPANDDDFQEKIPAYAEELDLIIEETEETEEPINPDNSNTHLIVLTTEQLEQLKSLNLASDINALLDNPTATYYHIYDDDYDCGLFTENDLRQYANDQQEYLPDVLDGEDDKVLLAELMAINPLTDDLDQVLRILDERGFNVDTYTANTVLDTYTANTVQELLSQIDTLIQR